jgi:hypothetical protein
MMNGNAESSVSLQETDLVDRVMRDPIIASFIAKNAKVEGRARGAAAWLVEKYSTAPDDQVVKTVRRLLEPLRDETLRVFFSYKSQDEQLANTIAAWLEEWSANKLVIQHMGRFGVEGVGRDWRQQIEQTIPRCDWFLLLLPSPGERDWTLFEAGYFQGAGHDFLAGRSVCLHHSDNEIADALGEDQSVPADVNNVKKFLEGLFHKPNWIPGMPPLNSKLSQLEEKAKMIVDLIQKPASQPVRSCCGPHMVVAFEDASAVTGWDQLALGRVIDSNEDCKRLFGLEVPKTWFGDWIAEVKGAKKDEGWIKELAKAVQAAGEGRQVPSIRSTFLVSDGRSMRPTICAVRRRRSDQRAEAVDILFSEAELPHDTSSMSPGLAALATTLQFSVRFRYQVLERYIGRKLDGKDVLAFYHAMIALQRQAAGDPRFAENHSLIRERTLSSFVGEDRVVLEKMYKRWDELWRPDGTGKMDQAIANMDGEALADTVKELIGTFQQFLTVTSKRFAELIAHD